MGVGYLGEEAVLIILELFTLLHSHVARLLAVIKHVSPHPYLLDGAVFILPNALLFTLKGEFLFDDGLFDGTNALLQPHLFLPLGRLGKLHPQPKRHTTMA